MPKQAPILNVFPPLAGSLWAGQIKDWMVSEAAIDKLNRTMKVRVFCPAQPDGDILRWVESALGETYGLAGAEVIPQVPQGMPVPPPEEEIPLPEPPPEEPEVLPPPDEAAEDPVLAAFRRTEEMRKAAMQTVQPVPPKEKKGKGSAKGSAPAGKVLFGRREIKRDPISMSKLSLDRGEVVVEGDVFAVNNRELKRRKAWVSSFDVTDYTGSIRVTKFVEGEEEKALITKIQEGQHLLIQGKLKMDRYLDDMVLEPAVIQVGKKTKREDTAGEKRVELHLHTAMSAMDALTPAGEAVKRAEAWGHRAIAITDHGVAQAYPDAWHAAKDIKVLYGVEAYFINDMDDRVVVHGDAEQDFHGEIVCFDIETTGLSRGKDAIIEIGAAVLRDGKVCETFNTFAAPGRTLPREIVELNTSPSGAS